MKIQLLEEQKHLAYNTGVQNCLKNIQKKEIKKHRKYEKQ